MVFIAVNPETRRHLACRCTVNELTATQDTTDGGRERMQALTHARPATAGLLSGQLSPLLQLREERREEREGFITLLYTSTPSSVKIIADWMDNVYEVNVTGFVNIELRQN